MIWKNAEDLGLEGRFKDEWKEFIVPLQSCYIHLEEGVEDKLVWSKKLATGEFSAKLGYRNCALQLHQGERNCGGNMFGKTKDL